MCYLAWMDREYKALRRLSMRIIFNNEINLSPRQSQGENQENATAIGAALTDEQTARFRQRRFGVVIRPETLRNMDRFTRYYIWIDEIHLFRLIVRFLRWHRYWWRMLETKCVGDNFEMFVTVSAILVTIIQKIWPLSKFCHQHPQIVTNIKSPSSTCHQHFVAIMIWSCSPCNIDTIDTIMPLNILYRNHELCGSTHIWCALWTKNGVSQKCLKKILHYKLKWIIWITWRLRRITPD